MRLERTRRLALVVAVVGLAVLGPRLTSRAHAQSARPPTTSNTDTDAEAKALFQAGKAAFDAGSFEEALSLFERSFERSHRPQLRYNIGLAADRLRQDDKALDAFYAYLADVPDADNRAEVEARIRALEKAQAEREDASVPTPDEVAAQTSSTSGTGDAVDASDGTRSDQGEAKPITKKWWFWTAIGAVVVTGVVIGVAAARGGSEPGEPFDSRSGIAVMALTRN